MTDGERHVVTGAFSYTGRYIATRLLDRGCRVVTLTNHPDRPDPFGGRVMSLPYRFDDPAALAKSLEGASVLYNTYWVRFSHGGTTFDQAVSNTQALFHAAKQAGVRRIVHVSITNPSEDSPLPYFRGKAVLEQSLKDAGVSYAVLRPTVIFGREDILINNIAWTLRRFPAFAIPGDGRYRLQPVDVEDMADLAVEAGTGIDNVTFDAVGPETFSFEDLVRSIAKIVGSRACIVHVPPGVALFLSAVIGRLVGDVVLTREEVQGLMSNLLVSSQPPTGRTRLSDWISQNAETLGRTYASEIGRHFR